MKLEGTTVTNELHERIKELERENNIKFSNTQKVLLTVEGSITNLLDVLYGTVSIFTLSRHFERADKEKAKLVNINEGDEINYREVIIHRRGQPLIYALSFIALNRCLPESHEDVMKGEIPLGKILRKYEIESRREIQNIYIEEQTDTLKSLFNMNEKFLSREYVVIENKEVVMWTKESFPISYFSDKM